MLNNLYPLLSAYVTQGVLAPKIDPRFYQLTQPDVASFDDIQLKAHYEEWAERKAAWRRQLRIVPAFWLRYRPPARRWKSAPVCIHR